MATCTIARCRQLPSRRTPPSATGAVCGQLPDDEAALGRRFRDGDPDAVRELYERFSRPLLTVALRHLFDAELAKDAVQQTFLQAPWLFQICRRVCIDQLRTQRARTETIDDHGQDPRLAVGGPSMEQAWTAFEVRRAIEELPPDARDIVRLVHLDGWTVQQTAELLELPIGTVKSRSFRAHQRLSVALAHVRAAGGAA
jgi:DNA-directed RNA polymerase specialized sigma24 family protein